MTVTYNHLNLPTAMSFGSNGSLSILYDQTGKQLRKTAAPTAGGGYTQDYVDGLEYRTNSGGTLTLETIYHTEGRITPFGAAYQYEYTIKDHLGNTRLTFADLNANGVVDVPGDILQENHYYPFGLKMNYTWMDNVALDNKYQFNGIERNEDLGLNLDLAVFRGYDAAVGRWWQVDSKPDMTSSPYSFVTNNPLRYGDPLGDTLRGVSELSAQRAQTIISNTFKGMGIKGNAAAALFKIGKDGKTFNQISAKDFRAAVKGLDRDGKALARGYMKVINMKETVTVDVVKRSEALSEKSIGILQTGKERATVKTGAQFDDGGNGAGLTGQRHIIIVMDSKNPGGISYSDGVSRPALPGETLAHELLGHWLGERNVPMTRCNCVEAVQASNMYLRSQGSNYTRNDHGAYTNGETFDPQAIPSYFQDSVPGTLDDGQN